MRTINTNHSFPRLMQDYREPPVRTPWAAPHEMPVNALVGGGTPRAFKTHMPVVSEARTKTGKRVLFIMHGGN